MNSDNKDSLPGLDDEVDLWPPDESDDDLNSQYPALDIDQPVREKAIFERKKKKFKDDISIAIRKVLNKDLGAAEIFNMIFNSFVINIPSDFVKDKLHCEIIRPALGSCKLSPENSEQLIEKLKNIGELKVAIGFKDRMVILVENFLDYFGYNGTYNVVESKDITAPSLKSDEEDIEDDDGDVVSSHPAHLQNNDNDMKKRALIYLQNEVIDKTPWEIEKRFCLFRGGVKSIDNTDPQNKGLPELVPTHVQKMRLEMEKAKKLQEKSIFDNTSFSNAYGEIVKTGLKVKAQYFRFLRGREKPAIDFYDNTLKHLHVEPKKSFVVIRDKINEKLNNKEIADLPNDLKRIIGNLKDKKYHAKFSYLDENNTLEKLLYLAMDAANNSDLTIETRNFCDRITDFLVVDENALNLKNNPNAIASTENHDDSDVQIAYYSSS
jgi:hypothetical protein